METLNYYWNEPSYRESLRQAIVTKYNNSTQDTLDIKEATCIENVLFDYCHTLRHCNMLFDTDDMSTEQIRDLLTEIITHKTYALVQEYRAMKSALSVDNGKTHTQESYYDVADTPRIDRTEFNLSDIQMRQLDQLYQHAAVVQQVYKEIKCLVQTVYW